MTEPRYPQLHVEVPAEAVELVSAELFELGALGVEERDATTLVRGGSAGTTLVASFADDAAAHAAQDELGARHMARVEHVVGDGWRDGWRAFWKPLRVGERIVVRPSWEPFAAGPSDLVLTLDPGQAFGTGTHETTQLLLRELERVVQPGMRVLDVGTGSGILAIAALLLGAERATAIDVDPLALDAARENAAANAVARRLQVSLDPLTGIDERFPLVLANIEARVLVPMAGELSARVEAGGVLMLSGLLRAEGAPVRAAYPGFELVAAPALREWCALVLREAARG